MPSPFAAKRGESLVSLPSSVWVKVLLLNEMLAQKVRPIELARRMGVRPQEVTRIMDLKHATKIDAVQAAIAALGRKLELSLAA